MKKIILIFVLLVICKPCFCQSAFDKALTEISNDLAEKLTRKDKKKVVVLYITDVNKAQTIAGKYFADMVSYNIINYSSNLSVFYRENLQSIVEAKKLIDEGYISAQSAKDLGRLLAIEVIVIGNYTILSSSIKLSANALDVNSGLVIAASIKDLPLNADAGALLGINIGEPSERNLSNKGFNNTPLNSGESYNNPETVNKDCIINKTGDFCFTNNSGGLVEVELYQTDAVGSGFDRERKRWQSGEIKIDAGQTQCFYKITGDSYRFSVFNRDKYEQFKSTPTRERRYDDPFEIKNRFTRTGNVLVEKCKSKTYIVK